MTLMIDTHVLLWYMWDEPRLSRHLKSEIENSQNTILVSNASLWEMAIKISTGKLRLSMSVLEVEKYLKEKSIDQVNFSFQDLDILSKLPFYHNDPFDRLIIAQALTRNCKVISDDAKFKLYPVQLL